MHLTPEMQEACILDFDYIRRRLALSTHKFHRDAMINAVQAMIIDFFDFHATLYHHDDTVTQQYAALMNKFLALLERGDFRKNREIGYYADILRNMGNNPRNLFPSSFGDFLLLRSRNQIPLYEGR